MNRIQKMIIPVVWFVIIMSGVFFADFKMGQASEYTRPHGEYTQDTSKCGYCHSSHKSVSALVLGYEPKILCYNCHDGSNSNYNVKGEFGDTIIGSVYQSYHPVPSGPQVCTDCHNPHLDANVTPRLLQVGPDKISSGNAVCGVCHGADTNLPGGNIISPFENTLHGTKIVAPPTGTQINCLKCHQPHGSPFDALIRTSIPDQDGATHIVTGNNNTVCYACHTQLNGTYPGMSTVSQSKHASVTQSAVALTVWPGLTNTGGMCLNCHNPHGTGRDYNLRADRGNALCFKCHTQPDNSWSGSENYSLSSHSTMAAPKNINTYRSNSSGFMAWQGSSPLTPEPGSGAAVQSDLDAILYPDSDAWRTGLAHVEGDYNYQMFRFKIRETAAQISQFKIDWTGWGEPTSGHNTEIKIWDHSQNNWETIQSSLIGTQQTVSFTKNANIGNYVDGQGNLYVLARAMHDQTQPAITEGPEVNDVTPTSAGILGKLNEQATTYIDYGPTTAYGTESGPTPLGTSFSFSLSNLVPDTEYHYRIRGVDALGNTFTSGDYSFIPPAPVLTPIGDSANMSPTFSWSGIGDSSRGPYTYRLSVSNSAGQIYDSGWTLNGTSKLLNLDYDHYTWKVAAKDNNGKWSGWSAPGAFNIIDTSCPILYTWDGKKYNFVSDVMTFGSLGIPRGKNLYRYPPSSEETNIGSNLLKASEGKYTLVFKDELNEIEFIDKVSLKVVDHPAGTQLFINDFTRQKTRIDPVKYYTTQKLRPVKKATYINSPLYKGTRQVEDITDLVKSIDNRYAPASLYDDNQYILDLGDLSDAAEIKLAVNGWSQFPSNSERVTWLKSGAKEAERAMDVMGPDGKWLKIISDLPYTPGMTKSSVYDLTNKFPKGTKDFKVRLRGLPRTHFDYFAVDISKTLPVKIQELSPKKASLSYKGRSTYRRVPQPFFNYDKIQTSGQIMHEGNFTKYGDVLPLIQESDDMFAIIDTGDQIEFQFNAVPLQPGMVRDFVIYANGYFQEITGKVGKLPFKNMSNYPYAANEKYPDDAAHRNYQKEWNTREHKMINGTMVQVTTPSATKDEGLFHSLWASLKAFFNWIIDGFKSIFAESEKTAGLATKLANKETGSTQPRHYSLNTDEIKLEVTGSGSEPNGDCEICHAVHGKDDGTGNPVPKALKNSESQGCFNYNNGCHSDGVNSADNINISAKMNTMDDTAKHNLDCTYCHDPHSNNQEFSYSDADNRYAKFDHVGTLSDYISVDGSVYAMAGAQHDGTPPFISGSGVAVTGSSGQITWATNEPSNSTVVVSVYNDLSYSESYFDSGLVTTHLVSASPLEPGLYYYRIKSSDAVGNQAFTGISSFRVSEPPSTPVLTSPVVTVLPGLKATVDTSVYSGGVDPEGDPVQFAFEVRGAASGTATLYNYSDFASPGSWSITMTLPDWSPGTYYGRSRARDSNFAYSEWGPWVGFNLPKGDSCPFVFVWDGKKYQYVSDMSGLSINLARKYTKNFANLLPYYLNLDSLRPDNNRYKVKIRSLAEREIDLMDRAEIMVVDHPKGYQVLGNSGEYLGDIKQMVPRKLYTIKNPKIPVKALDRDGHDILDKVSAIDDRPAPVDKINPAGPDVYTFDFGNFDPRYAKIIIDGWTNYPNNSKFDQVKVLVKPQVQVIDENGKWKKVREIGFISGDLKPMVIDLSGQFPSSDKRVRIYVGKPYARMVVDRVRLDDSAPVPVQIHLVDPVVADLHARGPSKQYGDNLDHRVQAEDDDKPGPFTLNFYGRFTKYGDVLPLITKNDDMFVIMQHGDELNLEYPVLPKKPENDRTYLLSSDFYYKTPASLDDFNNASVRVPVEPLPSHKMSKYPYPSGEKYPDDPAHQQYQKEWNTREYEVFDGEIVLSDNISFIQRVWVPVRNWLQLVWQSLRQVFVNSRATTETPKEQGGLGVASNYRSNRMILPTSKLKLDFLGNEPHYSLNTDYVGLDVSSYNQMRSVYTSSTPGFLSWSKSTLPSVLNPGILADNSQNSALSSIDGTYWRTNLVTAEGDWNYQMYKFTVSEAVYKTQRISLYLRGYGEPTPGHDTKVALWNFRTSSWDTGDSVVTGSDSALVVLREDRSKSNCLACHDGTPPTGVTTSGVLNIASYYNPTGAWNRSLAQDPHGASVSSGWGGDLKPPYKRGYPGIPCEECHDAHGSANAYHLRENINGVSVTGIDADGRNAVNLCVACHESNYHQGCLNCHATDNLPVPATTAKCFACHRHSGLTQGDGHWQEPTQCHGCHTPYPYSGSGHGAIYNP